MSERHPIVPLVKEFLWVIDDEGNPIYDLHVAPARAQVVCFLRSERPPS